MVCAERLLEKLNVRDQFTKELYKDETAAGRTLLSCLGYWGPVVPVDIGKGIGIRNIKKLKNKKYHILREVSLDLIGIDIEERLEHLGLDLYPCSVYALLKAGDIASIVRRKDLYIKGLGKPKYQLRETYNTSLRSLKWSQYFEYVNSALKLSDEQLYRLVQLDFPEERIDELEFALYSGLNIMNNKLAVILRYLDNIVDRGLKEDWKDSHRIEYNDFMMELAHKNNMELPTCGRDLKRAALRFKNCAALYIERAIKGDTVIMYNDEHMAQINPRNNTLVQFYGKRNSKPTVDFIM